MRKATENQNWMYQQWTKPKSAVQCINHKSNFILIKQILICKICSRIVNVIGLWWEINPIFYLEGVKCQG